MIEPIASLKQAICSDEAAHLPLFARIAATIEQRIATGVLAAGVKLPAERELAAVLEVNRATVGRAYRELEARGLVSSRVGSGTVVQGSSPSASIPAGATAGGAPAGGRGERPAAGEGRFSRGIRDLAQSVSPGGQPPAAGDVDFALMLPDVGLFPPRRLAAAVEAALARGAEVLQYGSPAGLPALRQVVAERLRGRGIAAETEDVVIVNGIQQALDLLAKVLLDPGDAVAVEAPTYANVLPLLRLYGARIVGVPLDAEGIDAVRLEAALAEHRPRLLYTIPTFHNPTGATMSRARRHELLALCRRFGTRVIEDGFEEELRYRGQELPPLAALDPEVIHLGTFSKGLFPGLRLGYVVARGELRELLVLAKRYTDYHAGLLAQAVLAEILTRGDYDRHLARLRQTYAPRLERTLAALERELPPGVRFRRPEGGYSLWLELPPGVKASAVAEAARRRGVAVLAGPPFYSEPGAGESGLRLSISRTDPERIETGVAVLAEVLRAEGASARREGGAGESPSLV